MNKSIKFVKKRISSGAFTWLGSIKDKQIHLISYTTVVECGEFENEFFLKNKTMRARFKYNPDAEFDYLTFESCRCDGTLAFVPELFERIIAKVFGGKSCYEPKKPKDLYERPQDYEVSFEFGDFVFIEEHGEQFSTKDKPWLKSRFTVMLPVKCDFLKK